MDKPLPGMKGAAVADQADEFAPKSKARVHGGFVFEQAKYFFQGQYAGGFVSMNSPEHDN